MSTARTSAKWWRNGDWAQCNVHGYASLPYGKRVMVLGHHWCNGQLVLETVNPRYGGVSTYYAKNFVNYSRGERLTDNLPLDIPFDPPQEKKMIDKKQIVVAVPVPSNYSDADIKRGVIDINCIVGAYDAVVQDAGAVMSSGRVDKYVLLQPVAIVEPVANVRVRQL